MNATPLSAARQASYALALLALIVAARFSLGAALIAGLAAHMILKSGEEALAGAGASPRVARWTSVALFSVIGLLLAAIFAAFARIGVERLPTLLDRLLPRLDYIFNRVGLDWPADNVSELRALLLSALKENARSVTTASGLLTREFFRILLALIVALLHFVAPSAPTPPAKAGELDERLWNECRERAGRFAASLELVMGAQVVVAAINAAAAAAFLIAFRVPFRTMLTLTTFVCGLVPIVGTMISGTLIVAASLTVSEHLALAALIFLLVAHKGGYLLNSRVVGGRMETPTWAILLGLLAGEALMGVTGVILAPTLIHYVRAELRAVPSAPGIS
jgi:predicted PurR-regulated permease PerM